MKYATLLFALFALSACDFTKRLDTAAVVKEMKAKQVKRVLPQDVVNQVDTWGQEIQAKKTSKLDSATRALQISVRVGAPIDLKPTFKDAKMSEIMDALDYSLSQKQDIPPSIQKNTAGDSLYYFYPSEAGKITVLGFAKNIVIQNMDRPLIK
ncbi:MAG: hypothetical protein RJA67_1245 [Bacteroidota bacterium]|jgi:hypothetical protein